MRKLALLAAAVVVAVLAVHLWPDRTEEAAPPTSRPAETAAPAPPRTVPTAAPATPSAPTPTGTQGPYGGTDAARRDWEPVVQGFALAYPDTAGLTRAEWLANLEPFLDEELEAALATTDLAKVPRGHYAGYQLLKVADEALTVRVTYHEGWYLVLYLAATGKDAWNVVQLDRGLDAD